MMTRTPYFTLIALVALVSVGALASTPPELLNYQGVLRDDAGEPLTGAQDMVFRLFDDPTAGDEFLVDSHLAAGTGAVPVDGGLFQVSIGGGDVQDGSGPGSYTSLSAVFRDAADVYVEITINGETLLPRIRVKSAAFALNSSYLEGKNIADLTADTTALIGAHALDDDAHHTPYTDPDAVAAMGAKADGNPLHHDRRTDQEIADAAQLGGLSSGAANGFEIRDPWGFVWDGNQRPPETWQDATQDCESLGGRLPTATEIFRNNGTNGTGSLGNAQTTGFLWTRLANAALNQRTLIRVSDGIGTSSSETNPQAYRCIWPSAPSAAFDDAACNGQPGEPCATIGDLWNVDAEPRAVLDVEAAREECRFYGGRLPSLRHLSDLIRSGEESDNLFRWMSNMVFDSGNFFTVARWSGPGVPYWAWDGTNGSYSAAGTGWRFRCIGKRPDMPIVPAPSPSCNGGAGCYSSTVGGVTLQADSEDRGPANHAAASDTCRNLGGSLPRAAEFADLVRSGWASGTNINLWSGDPDRSGSNRTVRLYRFAGTGSEDWLTASNTTNDFAANSHNYRCVWRSTIETSATVCAADEQQEWDGTQYVCTTSSDGSSGGQALPVEFVDAWGNAWDANLRTPDTYAGAAAACSADGGRLPTLTEVYRVRNGNGIVPAIGSGAETTFGWSEAPFAVGTRAIIRVSDGATASSSEGSTQAYRCIWPGSSGDVLSGRACYGDPASSCFQSDRLRIDRLDRPLTRVSTAAWECAQSGGRLPVLDELQELIHAGAPDGSNDFLWLEQPLAASSNRYYAVARWAGPGTTAWAFDNTNGNAFFSTSSANFRCVWGDRYD